MKHIGILALLLGTSMMVSAAVVTPKPINQTQIRSVEPDRKQIAAEMPVTVDYSEELKSSDFDELRQMQGMVDGKYMRNALKMVRDNPEWVLKNTYNIDAKIDDLGDDANKKSLGWNSDPVGFQLDDNRPESDNWMDAVADVQVPEFLGDYSDLKAQQEEMRAYRQKGLDNIKKLDFKNIQQAPVRQAL